MTNCKVVMIARYSVEEHEMAASALILNQHTHRHGLRVPSGCNLGCVEA
jgi:hypothetical protein